MQAVKYTFQSADKNFADTIPHAKQTANQNKGLSVKFRFVSLGSDILNLSARLVYSTLIKLLNSRNFLSLIPPTSKRCSGLRKLPNFVRCSIIVCAVFAPIFGSFSSSLAEAVLILIADSEIRM